MPEAQAILVKVTYEDGSEKLFAERDAVVYRVGEYYVVVDHDMCTVIYGKDLLSTLKEFDRSIVSAEVVDE